MARERFLCLAVGIDSAGNQRRFRVTKLRGPGFKIYNDLAQHTIARFARDKRAGYQARDWVGLRRRQREPGGTHPARAHGGYMAA
jgi:hypothetical protein